jgi:hypothetical protein
MATEIEQRNEAKKEWTRRLRGKGHKMTWRIRRNIQTYNGQCGRCLGSVTVHPGGRSETYKLGWFGRQRCSGESR